jgi:DNA (cytosine-5)-methyltransferase 1
MWKEMARIIGEVRPRYTFIENSPMLTSRGLERVLADLAKMGFDAEWGVLSAADVGANHKRERIWIIGRNSKWKLANTNLFGHLHRQYEIDSTKKRVNALCNTSTSSKDVGNSEISGLSSCFEGQRERESWGASIGSAQWWQVEPPLDRVADGMADRVDRLKAIGNGQVPLCAATAWKLLNERFADREY